MIEVLQTHQGHALSLDVSLPSIATRQLLLEALAKASNIQIEDLICMTKDGEQLTDDVFDQLQENEQRGVSTSESRGVQAVKLFIFDRQYLYADLDALAQELEEEAHLELHLDEPEHINPPTPRCLTALLQWCSTLLEHMSTHNARSEQHFKQLRVIDEGTKVALSNLLSHAESVRGGAQELQVSAGDELTRMEKLLKGHTFDLKILSLVPINNKLLPEAKGRSKERLLADYVSPTKMGAVYQACSSVHDELRAALATLHGNDVQLCDDTEGLRQEVQNTNVEPSHETLQESVQALHRAQELVEFLQRNCAPDEHGWPAAQRLTEDTETLRIVEEAIGELVLLDEVCRESLRRLCADKNDMVARSLHLLSDISSLQSEYADLGIELSQFDAEIKSNRTDGFRHLLRLKNMLWAYGSTLIEIFRRQEFEKHFLIRSQALAELMANFSENERKRRTEFRSHVVGALPWEIKGMEESTPSLDISTGTTLSRDGTIKVHREDIEQLFSVLSSIEDNLEVAEDAGAVQEIGTALRGALQRVDEYEAEFVRLAENTLLDGDDSSENDEEGEEGRGVQARRRYKRSDANHTQVLQTLKIEHGEHLRSLLQAHDKELYALQAELSKAKSELRQAESGMEKEKAHTAELNSAITSNRHEKAAEAAKIAELQGEAMEMRKEVDRLKKGEANALQKASDEAEKASDLEARLHDAQVELEEVRAAHGDASKRVEALLSKGTSFEDELSVAQDRIDDLTHTLSEVRAEAREARDALSEAEQARDKAMRSYRAEADGDRAILEESLRAKSGELHDAHVTISRIEAELVEYNDNVKNLQSQLTAADEAHTELVQQLELSKETAMEVEMSKRQSDRSLEATLEKVRALVSRTILLSDVLARMPSLAGQTTKSGNKLVSEAREKLEEGMEKERHRSFEQFKLAGDKAPTELILDVLTWLTKAPIEEAAIERLEVLTTLCKKWMKAYKHTNEKGQKQQLLLREKITFRSFSVGDLALFLPTRGNVPVSQQDGVQNGQVQTINFAKPWAAFNINFPHYFLNFKGTPENEQLRESLRQKEWIVARITKIEGKVASSRNPDGNPFNLAEGVRFFLLDVENWNLANALQPPPNARRKSTSIAPTPSDRKKGDTSPPPLRRWDSTPEGGVSVKIPPPAIAENEQSLQGEEAHIALDERRPSHPTTSASNGSLVEDAGALIAVPEDGASKPSGLALALRQQQVVNVHAKASAAAPPSALATSPDRTAAVRHNVGNLGGSSARWSTSLSYSHTPGSTGPTPPSSSLASDRFVAKLANSTTPAFGRAKRFVPGSMASEVDETNSAVTRSTASSPNTQASERKSIAGILQPKGVARMRAEDAGHALNPFSSSPAPVASEGLAAMERGLAGNREQVDVKGKGREEASEAAEIPDRSQSRSSLASSHTTRKAPLSINSRSTAILSPRIRAPDQARPTMETAKGLNSFGRSAVVSEGSQGGSGFSPQAAAAGASSLGSHPSASAFSIRSSESTGGKQNEEVRASSNSQLSANPSSPSTRRSSFFGTGWTLGRRSGSRASSSVPVEDGDGDMSATVVDARQSLRRLTGAK